MDKASKAIRRSGVRLRSMSSGHGNLQMVISQLGEVRNNFKAFMQAQATGAEDLLQWSCSSTENRAIEETFGYMAELSLLWTEVQKDFSDQLKEYRTQYELILEGERNVTQARDILAGREQREGKLRKELKKANKKAPVEEIRLLQEKLSQAERSRDLAHQEVMERVSENEAVKMIRVKEGLLKLGAAYYELAQKCMIIFAAHQRVASQLPDVISRDLHDVKYTGSGSAKSYVQEAKDEVRAYRYSSKLMKPSVPEDPPPPYTPSVEHLDDLPHGVHNGVPHNAYPWHRPPAPSAPRASNASFATPDHSSPGGVPPVSTPSSTNQAASHHPNTATPTVPSVPCHTHVYPELPEPSQSHPPRVIHSPSLPEKHYPPQVPDSPSSPHSNSAPNLVDGSSASPTLTYPPLSANDNSCFNETSFHPDTSSSSPNLSKSHYTNQETAENMSPFNPDYDWLPGRDNKGGKMGTSPEGSHSENFNQPEKKVVARHHSYTESPSVRPRVNTNPFLDDYEEDLPDENLSGAMRKTSVR